MFVRAGFYGLLVRWLTTTADHGRSQRDDESCSQASTSLPRCRYLLYENIKRALSVAPGTRSFHTFRLIRAEGTVEGHSCGMCCCSRVLRFDYQYNDGRYTHVIA